MYPYITQRHGGSALPASLRASLPVCSPSILYPGPTQGHGTLCPFPKKTPIIRHIKTIVIYNICTPLDNGHKLCHTIIPNNGESRWIILAN